MRIGSRTVHILSIDGGGIRGLIPALVLAELHRRLVSHGCDQHLGELFDLIAGTSSGSFIALGLALPARTASEQSERPGWGRNPSPALHIEDIVRLFSENALAIFPSSTFRGLRTVKQAFAEKYEPQGLERALERIFGDVTMQEAVTNLLVTSYDTERLAPFFFKKRPRREGQPADLNFRMRDAARASSAAPTFFEPASVSPIPATGKRFCLVDGGLFANNPAMCAYIEARKIFPGAKRYHILSLGTGLPTTSYGYEEVRRWGFLEWVSPTRGVPLVTVMTQGQNEAAIHQLARLPEVELVRIDGSLEGCNDAIDDASDANMVNLARLADRIIRGNRDALDAASVELAR